MAAIDSSKLADELLEILNVYNENVQQAIVEAIRNVTKEGKAKVKAASPKRSGAYARGWTSTVTAKDGQASSRIYNKAYPGLTHLLENGHVVRNGTGRIGQGKKTTVKGITHIGPVNDAVQRDIEKAIEEAIHNAE